jgi:isopentenyl diphosphate isomerase/L-lactate dehydrogenase-like FMN-dependent dehydrogenase
MSSFSLDSLPKHLSLIPFSKSLIIQTEFFNSGSTGQITVRENTTAYLKYRRACAKRGINMGVSSYSNYSVEEVIQAGREVRDMAHVMQLYTMKDRAMEERIIKRAEAAGCKAIFLAADSPVLGVRYNEWRNDFRTPDGLGFPMLERTSEQIMAQTHDSGFMAFNSDSHSWLMTSLGSEAERRWRSGSRGCSLRRMFCWRGSMDVRA